MTVPTNHYDVFRQYRLVLKGIACITLVAFLSLNLQPLAAALNAPAAPNTLKTPVKVKTHAHHLAETVDRIEAELATLNTQLTRKQSTKKSLKQLKALHKQIQQLDKKVLADFAQQRKTLKTKKLPAVILERHDAAVAHYQKAFTALRNNLKEIHAAKDDATRKPQVTKAHTQLKHHQKKKSQVPFDPEALSHGSFKKAPKNKPKLKKTDFKAAGLFDNPNIQLASHGSFTFGQLRGADNPAYLEATTEVILSAAIKAKASELNHHPVKIYNWVRNNVEWLPTWGAQQDAEVTLGSRRGNSLDISSLLIALYRASGIPARYVHGTIERTPAQFRNWAGGFNDTFAAMEFAAFGGIPITQVVTGGKITAVQLEHVWVDAAIDFTPSRGAINKRADTWIQLDASYKQYAFKPGLDVIQISGLDPNALATVFTQSGTINESEGWVQGLDPNILQAAQTQAQQSLEDYINQNITNPTVGDVMGGKTIITEHGQYLPSSMYAKTLVAGARYGYLPVPLQNFMTFAFGRDAMGELINPVSFPFPYLNNHKVTLSFKPATPEDEAALLALLPEGEITDLSQLPGSIPSYLINVIPTLAVEGIVRGQGQAMRLGEEIKFIQSVTRRGNLPDTLTYPVTAGSYLNVMVGGGSVSPEKLTQLQTKLTQTKTIFESGDMAQMSTLTQEDLLGDMFFGGSLGYFGKYISIGKLSAQAEQAHHGLVAGYGTLGYEPNVFYFFGFPTAIQPGGIAVNVRVGGVYGDSSNDKQKRIDFSFQMGLLSSALEHIVPELLFTTDPANPIQSVSAVKALQLAAQQGQRIYHITQANAAQTLPNINIGSEAKSEILSALNMGREVITHTSNISIPGWTGAGYILFEPDSGQGAFKITGGSNGSDSDWCNGFVFALKIVLIVILIIAILAVLIASIAALAAAAAVVAEIVVAVSAYISAALAGISVAAKAAIIGILLGSVATSASANVSEICPLSQSFTDVCEYTCASDGHRFYTPRPREAGDCGVLKPCKGAAPRP